MKVLDVSDRGLDDCKACLGKSESSVLLELRLRSLGGAEENFTSVE